jgi:hypothetical protein
MGSFAGHYVSLMTLMLSLPFSISGSLTADIEETTQLKEYYDKAIGSGIEVCCQSQHDREKWEKYIVDLTHSWINGWNPQR